MRKGRDACGVRQARGGATAAALHAATESVSKGKSHRSGMFPIKPGVPEICVD